MWGFNDLLNKYGPILGALGTPEFGHTISNLLPHSTQNLAVSGFSNGHFGHFIIEAL